MAAGVAGNVAAGVAEGTVNGQVPTLGSVAEDAAVGGALGVVGGVAGSRLSKGLSSLTRSQKGKLGENLTSAKELARGYIDTGRMSAPAGGLTATGRAREAILDHSFRSVLTGNAKVVESKFGPGAALTKNQRDARGLGFDFEVNKMTPDSVSGAAAGTGSGGAAAGGSSNPSTPEPYQ